MKLFTRRFVKDILLIVLFGISFYILTHNSITHPKPKVIRGEWSIQLMQYPLVFGIAGHNYLTLRDTKNTTVKELHGLATDNKTGIWKYTGTDPADKLKVWEFLGSDTYIAEKSYSGILLTKGNKDEMTTTWNKAKPCTKAINDKNLPYPPYGVTLHGDTENSNSVAYTLSICMGLSTEHLGLITPGWGKNLLSSN